jgi:hypothetical protein
MKAQDMRRSWELCRKMGRLAHWWLRPEVVATARRFAPGSSALRLGEPLELPEKLGDCWIVFRTGRSRKQFRPACLLPLSWRPGRGHSPVMPRRLALLADRVLADIKLGNDWGLHPADELQIGSPRSRGAEYLSHVNVRCSSGWAPLAAGLFARAEGLLPQKNVWASGAWNEFGLADVQGLEPKLELAASWPDGSAGARTDAIAFFVPPWRAGKASAWVDEHAPGRVEIDILDATPDRDARKALNRYLAKLLACPAAPVPGAPDEEEQFARCRDWLLHQPPSVGLESRERSYYRSHLLPGIIRRMSDRVRTTAPAGFEATHLATIVSKNHELTMFSAPALRVQYCLLLHTPDGDMPVRARKCAEYLQTQDITCVVRAFDAGLDMESQISAEIAAFTRGVPPELVVIDLKPGTKKMTYAQSRAARPGNWIFNLEGGFRDDGRSIPGAERPELWRAAE